MSRLTDFWSDLERFGGSIALALENGREISYLELADLADAFAASLPAQAKLIALEGTNQLEAIAAYLGVLRSGRVAMMLPKGAEAAASICSAFPPDARYTSAAGQWALTSEEKSTPVHRDLALLLSTSGTTGAAKLVRLSSANLAANAASIVDYLAIDSEETAITTLPISYSYGLSVINSHLAGGARIALTERSVIDKEFWRFAARVQATSLAGVPHTYELLAGTRHFADAPGSLRTLTQAGGRMAPDLVRRFAADMAARGGRLFVMYGQTEATARMAYLPPDMAAAHADCIGIAIPGGAFRLRTPSGAMIEAAGQQGELCYRGPNVMMGYAHGPADLATGAMLDELATGDLAERNERGLYRIVGRQSRFVKPLGLRVALDEIERKLETAGWPAMVAGTDELIVVAVQASEADGDERQQIHSDLAARYGLPLSLLRVVAVDAFPHLANGKRDHAALLREHGAPVVHLPAVSLTAMFEEHLGVAVSEHDSFIGVGGDSIAFVNLSLALEEVVGELPDQWEQMTVAELEALSSRGAPARTGTNSGWVDSSMAVRAAAIALVVANHASPVRVGGGTLPLIMLIGLSWAWLQHKAFAAGNVALTMRVLRRVLPPYFFLIAATAWWREEPGLSSLFLVSNYDPHLRGMLQPLWFVSALVQVTLLMAVLVSVSERLRRMIATRPFALGLRAFALAAAFQLVCQAAGIGIMHRSLDQVLPIIALGWLAGFAHRDAHGAKITLLCLGVLLSIELLMRPMSATQGWPLSLNHTVLPFALVAVLFFRKVALGPLARPVKALAAASFTIYITHSPILWVIGRLVDDAEPGLAAAAFALLVGTCVHLSGTGILRFWQAERPSLGGRAAARSASGGQA